MTKLSENKKIIILVLISGEKQATIKRKKSSSFITSNEQRKNINGIKKIRKKIGAQKIKIKK